MKAISVVGYKKSGKTKLVSALVRKLSGFGPVGTIKHMGDFRYNPGDTDTGRHFEAGAGMVIGLTDTEMVGFSGEPGLERALDALCDRGIDFAVVEGFKDSLLPKIVLGNLQDPSNVLMRLPEKPDLPEALLDSMLGQIFAQPDRYTLEALIKKARKNPEIRKAGAIGTFTGLVREIEGEKKTSRLEFETYEPEASRVLDRICEEIKQKEGILEVLIHHRAGAVKAGEDIVYIVIASVHRAELFSALSEAIERIKSEALIWKKEFKEKEEFWAHERGH